MIDVSDGLGADAGTSCGRSEVALAIELDSVPIQAGVERARRGRRARPDCDLAIAGGEDYELLATIGPPDMERRGGGLPPAAPR